MASAAFIDWKLMVNKATRITITHQATGMAMISANTTNAKKSVDSFFYNDGTEAQALCECDFFKGFRERECNPKDELNEWGYEQVIRSFGS